MATSWQPESMQLSEALFKEEMDNGFNVNLYSQEYDLRLQTIYTIFRISTRHTKPTGTIEYKQLRTKYIFMLDGWGGHVGATDIHVAYIQCSQELLKKGEESVELRTPVHKQIT